MTNDIHPEKTNGHADYERRDIGVRAVYYFLGGLVLALVVTYLAVSVFFRVLEKRSQADQTPVSPLAATAPADTRRLPHEYKTDSEGADYEKYLRKNLMKFVSSEKPSCSATSPALRCVCASNLRPSKSTR